MNNKIKGYLVTIAYVILTIELVTCFVQNIQNPWQAMFLCMAIIGLFTVRQIALIGKEFSKLYFVYVLIETLLIFILGKYNDGTSFVVFYFVIIYDVIFELQGFYFLPFSIGFYLLTSYINYIKFNGRSIVSFYTLEFNNFILFSFVIIITYLLKYICSINGKLEDTSSKLSIKNIQLEDSFENIKKAYEKNEDYIVLNTRNSFAREIHDTVGHTLTTALVEMEASKVLMNENKIGAYDKLDSSINQVRKGLRQVRTSVRNFDKQDIDYYNEVIELINNTILHTEVAIRYDIDDFKGEDELVKRCIFRALQEGISNGIRHGEATAFLFKLKYKGNMLKFSLENNGKGISHFQKGFGLKAMEERVKEANGILNIMTDIGEGFNIYIDFNIGGEF
ncbi:MULTISPECIES: sensor histidine kinase [Clostridium]|uniref:sensor histidine kinase n=1 Tax=Clostridium TaxID=1485 RepID=UPI000825DBAC|nr:MULTISPECIES: histidine kinase [Clostridium]PJI09302.1 sensor histidine kinase [Clostridium sp. CT7]